MATNEKSLVADIIAAILAVYPNAWIMKVHGGQYQMTGVPDLLVCVEGLLIGLEVKHQKPGESLTHAYDRTTALQAKQIRDIIRAGGTAGTVVSVEESLEYIDRALSTT